MDDFPSFSHAERGMTRWPPNVEQIAVEVGLSTAWLITKRNDTELRFPLEQDDCLHLAKLLTAAADAVGVVGG